MILSNLVLAILPFILVSIGFYGYLSNIMEKRISDVTNTAFKGIDSRINDYMTTIESISKVCFYNPNFHRTIADPGKLYYEEKREISLGFLTNMTLDKSIKDIAVVLNDGQVISGQGSVDEKSIATFRQDIEKNPDSGPIMYWSKDKVYPYNVYYVKPIKSIIKNSLLNDIGIGIFILDKRQMSQFYNSSSFEGIADIYLVDEDGYILDSNIKDKSTDKIDEKLLKVEGEGTATLNGIKYHIKTADIKYSKFRLIAAIPTNIQYKDLMNTQLFLAVSLSLILILIIFVNIYFNYRFTLPLKKLSRAFSEFAASSFKTRILIEEKDEVTAIVNQFNTMANDVRETTSKIFLTQQQLYETEIVKKQLEINSLYNQINSHFLYNTLSCIRAMARSNSPDQVSRMITCLERYFRYTSRSNEYATAQEEIEHLEIYLQIQNTRYDKDIIMEVHLPEDIRLMPIPKLILQPIIENSIAYGFNNMSVNCLINIRFEMIEHNLCIRISDNGCGMEDTKLAQLRVNLGRDIQEVVQNRGIGLMNTKKRLEVLYGDNFVFDISSRKNEGTCITIQFKLQD